MKPELRRAMLLATTLAAGTAVGALAWWATGSPWAWGAVPAALALVWWRVADTTQCEPVRTPSAPPR